MLRLGAVCAVLVSIASGVYAAESSLVLKLDRTEIRLLDPLFVKAILTNHGSAPLGLPNPLGTEFDTLRFEVRPVGDESFRGIRSVFEPGGNSPPAPKELRPGATVVSYELITTYPGRYGFPGPGTYEFRVRLRDHKDTTTAVSAVQTIRVARVQPDKMGSELEAARLVSYAIGSSRGGVPFTLTRDRLAAARDALNDSGLKDCLGWLTALAEIRDGRHPEQIDRGRRQIDNARLKASPVVQEHIARVAALQYIYTRRWEWAREEIARLKGRDYTFEQMELECKDYLCPPAKDRKSNSKGTRGENGQIE